MFLCRELKSIVNSECAILDSTFNVAHLVESEANRKLDEEHRFD